MLPMVWSGLVRPAGRMILYRDSEVDLKSRAKILGLLRSLSSTSESHKINAPYTLAHVRTASAATAFQAICRVSELPLETCHGGAKSALEEEGVQ